MQDALSHHAPSLMEDVCHQGTFDHHQNSVVYQTRDPGKTGLHHDLETLVPLSDVCQTFPHLPETPGTSEPHHRSSEDLGGNPVWEESHVQIPAKSQIAHNKQCNSVVTFRVLVENNTDFNSCLTLNTTTIMQMWPREKQSKLSTNQKQQLAGIKLDAGWNRYHRPRNLHGVS